MALFRRKPTIGVLELHGMIGASIRPGVYYQLLDRIERNARIGVVVLDIDSPGGSSSASEDLYLKLRRLREKKPIVAFIRGTGASGSYMLACAATKIMALPSAIVGSIGVISMRPVVVELMERLGVSVAVNKSAPLKDMGAFYRAPTPEEDAKLQSLVDELYQSFLELVAKERGMELDQIRQYATGEVFTGNHGKEIGLVDELGDFDDALDLAASLGNVPRRTTYIRPPRSLRVRLLGRFGNALMEEVVEEIQALYTRRLWYM